MIVTETFRPKENVEKALNAVKNPLKAVHKARVDSTIKKATKASAGGGEGSISRTEKYYAKARRIRNAAGTKGYDKTDIAIVGGVTASLLAATAIMALTIKKMRKNDPNSAVLKEAEKKVKAINKEIKQAQKELKKAGTPAETKAAEKKIKKLEAKVTKLKNQIGRLADKNLSPKEVEAVKKRLEKMIAESVLPAYTEAELMFTEMQALTASIMADHYYAVMLEAEEEAAEMEDIFGEDADDFDDDFFEDADDYDFDEFEESAEDDLFDDFDFDF